MPSIKEFVEALSASWPVALAALLGSSAIVLTKDWGIIPSWGISVAFVIGAFAGAVLIVLMIRSIGSWIARWRGRRSWERMKEKQLIQLGSLSQAETLVAIWAAANRTQVFSAPYFHPAVQALRAKLLIEEIPGSHISDSVPFRFPDHVWEAITRDYQGLPNGDVLRGQSFQNAVAHRLI